MNAPGLVSFIKSLYIITANFRCKVFVSFTAERLFIGIAHFIKFIFEYNFIIYTEI